MQNGSRQCGDDALLLWYAAGSLAPEEAGRVEAHVEHCARCQSLVAETAQMAELFAALPASERMHLAGARLLELAERGRETTLEERQHLTGCSECSQILSVLEKVHLEEDPAERRPLLERIAGAISARASGLGPWLRTPAPAYLLLLLLLYPAYRGVFEIRNLESRIDTLESPTLIVTPSELHSERERGEEGAGEELRVDTGSHHVVLTFFVPVNFDTNRYLLELRSADGRLLYRETEARSFDAMGTFVLLIPRARMAPGDYELVLQERRRAADTLENTFTYPFSVTPAPE